MGEIRCLDMVHGCNNQLAQTVQEIHQAATSCHPLLKLNGSHACAISEIFKGFIKICFKKKKKRQACCWLLGNITALTTTFIVDLFTAVEWTSLVLPLLARRQNSNLYFSDFTGSVVSLNSVFVLNTV